MGNLCCQSKKNEQKRKQVDNDLTDDLMKLEERLEQASAEDTQISSSSATQEKEPETNSLTGLKYEHDFLRFLDTHELFKKDKSQLMDGNFLEFNYFLDFYRASMMWNKVLFLDQKKSMVK